MKQTIIILIFIVVQISCNRSNKPLPAGYKNPEIDTNKTAMAFQTNPENDVEKDTIVYDNHRFPNGNYTLKVLSTSTFHGDEVPQDFDQVDWLGIFSGKQGYYIKDTNIKMDRIHDEILDEDNENTGWEISTENKDTCIILIENNPILSERKIQPIKLPNMVYPGDTIAFNYLGIKYSIFATGGKRKTQEEPEWFEVWNYKLFITADIKGQNRKSLLIAHPNFDEYMTSILFSGDIDGDGILDLIIDASNHYNGIRQTIYLSKPAEQGEILKPIGEISSVGC